MLNVKLKLILEAAYYDKGDERVNTSVGEVGINSKVLVNNTTFLAGDTA